MGPPIYIGGNFNNRIGIFQVTEASMGPPIYIGGNKEVPILIDEKLISFNGATDLHRWKPLL